MRSALRWLVFLVPMTIFLLYLHRSGSSTPVNLGVGAKHAVVSSQLPAASVSGVDTDLETQAQPSGDIGAFWRKWSQAMYEVRPNASAIKVTGTATTAPPTNANGPRKPYRDLVRNSADDIELLRQSHARFVTMLGTLNPNADADIFRGRGVVMVGGGEYFGPAIVGIHMLRRTGSSLPVEVFVPNDDDYEAELCDQYLPRLNARCVVLSHYQSHKTEEGESLKIRHYQLKAPALLLSSFAEVLLLDSDSIPLVDPDTAIFASEPYLSSGLITWPDFWAATESPRFWTIAGVSGYPSGLPPTSSESGQLVINKKTHLEPLLLAAYYNIYGQQYYYPLQSQGALGQGDKETFMAAAVGLNASYYRVKSPAASLGRNDGRKHKGTAIVQHLPSDDLASSQGGTDQIRPAFLHSNTPKMNAGHLVDEGDLFAVNGAYRLRLLGPKLDQLKMFGFDVEDSLWDLLVQTGCELADVIREWKGRVRLCERLMEHHQLMFGEGEQQIG
ncbi:mannosyltransferase putative-domain-containing protein [Xylariales sp. AK1849]|nr:mannosyltransferase putative-domain-containing protein [Xylariales sp. AK1849]